MQTVKERKAYEKQYYRKHKERICARMQEYWRKRQVFVEKQCISCNTPFKTCRKRQLFCSLYCKNGSYRYHRRKAAGKCTRCGRSVETFGRSRCLLCNRRQNLRRKHNLSLQDYDNMFSQQNGCCLICQKNGKRLDVDHCHTSGVTRGLLCNACNTRLGWYENHKEAITVHLEKG